MFESRVTRGGGNPLIVMKVGCSGRRKLQILCPPIPYSFGKEDAAKEHVKGLTELLSRVVFTQTVGVHLVS